MAAHFYHRIFFFIALNCVGITFAQHDHHITKDTVKMDSMQMTSVFSPNLPMSRDGSGTSWQPDSSPLFMYMKMLGKNKKGITSLMVHGNIFLRYTSQDFTNQGNRGNDKFDAPNWFMIALSHKHKKDVFSLLTMLSMDPFTVGGRGYPLLFQSGETYDNVPLVDRQHPHDLISQLGINYTRSFTKNIDVNAYFGYPGEPALGPSAFMHRISAMNNPDAPLSHHWQDATHTSFGTGTIGFRYKNVKGEGSIFTGREPDENRYNFDDAKFDSYSYRLSVNSGNNFSFQFSQGFIKSPEVLEPETNIVRTTASILHTTQFQNGQFISSSFVWGQNRLSNRQTLNSYLLESNLKLLPISIYGRYEFVEKNAHELNLDQFTGNPTFNIQALTLGVNRKLLSHFKTDLSIGLQGTINFPDDQLKPIYGNNPLAAQIFLRISPAIHSDNHSGHK